VSFSYLTSSLLLFKYENKTQRRNVAAFFCFQWALGYRPKHLSFKKQLTADERRYTLINQRLGENIGLTKMVIQFYCISPGYLGVYPFFSAVNCRLCLLFSMEPGIHSSVVHPKNGSSL